MPCYLNDGLQFRESYLIVNLKKKITLRVLYRVKCSNFLWKVLESRANPRCNKCVVGSVVQFYSFLFIHFLWIFALNFYYPVFIVWSAHLFYNRDEIVKKNWPPVNNLNVSSELVIWLSLYRCIGINGLFQCKCYLG